MHGVYKNTLDLVVHFFFCLVEIKSQSNDRILSVFNAIMAGIIIIRYNLIHTKVFNEQTYGSNKNLPFFHCWNLVSMCVMYSKTHL